MQVELAQIPIRDGEREPNLERVLAVVDAADTAGGTELVIFPETTLCGFPSAGKVAGVAEPWDGPSVTAVRQAAKNTGVAVAFGFGEAADGVFYNSTMLVDKHGDVVLHYRKTHLWPTDLGVFAPGNRLPTAVWNNRRVGILICFDIEFPEPARALARQGAELFIVTNGNMDPYGPVHARAAAARAMENQAFIAMANRVGTGAGGLTFPGESALVDPMGNMSVVAGSTETVQKAVIDWSLLDESRREYHYVKQARIGLTLGESENCLEIE